jgi:predicted NodU family carbamoyl transferase
VDGRIVADVAEERFTRTKHFAGLPIHALDYCLKSSELTMADIDAVAVPTCQPSPELNFLLDLKGAKAERYSDKEVEDVLKLRQLEYRRVDNVEEFAARQLAEDKIVAWFQGRMESGPRALGARSILMSANRPENKDIINARVKFREAFRPFCPSLLREKREDYLEHARDEFS